MTVESMKNREQLETTADPARRPSTASCRPSSGNGRRGGRPTQPLPLAPRRGLRQPRRRSPRLCRPRRRRAIQVAARRPPGHRVTSGRRGEIVSCSLPKIDTQARPHGRHGVRPAGRRVPGMLRRRPLRHVGRLEDRLPEPWRARQLTARHRDMGQRPEPPRGGSRVPRFREARRGARSRSAPPASPDQAVSPARTLPGTTVSLPSLTSADASPARISARSASYTRFL